MKEWFMQNFPSGQWTWGYVVAIPICAVVIMAIMHLIFGRTQR